MCAITHAALCSAIIDVRRKMILAEADLRAEDVPAAADVLHAARDTMCGMLDMPFPQILRQTAVVGRSGLIASLHGIVATCDRFLDCSARESLLPKIAPLTLDQWASASGAEAAKGIVAMLTFVLGSPLVQTVILIRNHEEFN